MMTRLKTNKITDCGHASVSDLSAYLVISTTKVPAVAEDIGLKSNRVGKFAETNIWRVCGYIGHVPHEFEPLLDSKLGANFLGVSRLMRA